MQLEKQIMIQIALEAKRRLERRLGHETEENETKNLFTVGVEIDLRGEREEAAGYPGRLYWNRDFNSLLEPELELI
jgi:hypothetical protein